MLVPAGHSVTFRYRFILHEGDEKAGRVAEEYSRYSKDEEPLGQP
jgi:hypothetical protein